VLPHGTARTAEILIRNRQYSLADCAKAVETAQINSCLVKGFLSKATPSGTPSTLVTYPVMSTPAIDEVTAKGRREGRKASSPIELHLDRSNVVDTRGLTLEGYTNSKRKKR
jgi:hypothetical protein